MVVAMVAVGVVEVAVDQIIDMVPMGHCLVAASITVAVILVVARTGVVRGTVSPILGGHGQGVLIDVVFMGMMKVAIMKVIDVAVVLDGRVATSLAVGMGVLAVSCVCRHGYLL